MSHVDNGGFIILKHMVFESRENGYNSVFPAALAYEHWHQNKNYLPLNQYNRHP